MDCLETAIIVLNAVNLLHSIEALSNLDFISMFWYIFDFRPNSDIWFEVVNVSLNDCMVVVSVTVAISNSEVNSSPQKNNNGILDGKLNNNKHFVTW